MKFAAALVTLAVGAMASKSFEPSHTADEEVVYTTEVVTAITTYCPEATTITYGESTYTVTEATTLTITNCEAGCTIKVPVTTVSSVVCEDCSAPASFVSTPGSSFPVPTTTEVPTVSVPIVTPTTTPPVVEAGAGKAAALSGGALAGILGVAALVL